MLAQLAQLFETVKQSLWWPMSAADGRVACTQQDSDLCRDMELWLTVLRLACCVRGTSGGHLFRDRNETVTE